MLPVSEVRCLRRVVYLLYNIDQVGIWNFSQKNDLVFELFSPLRLKTLKIHSIVSSTITFKPVMYSDK